MAGDLIGTEYQGNAAQGLGSNANIGIPDQHPDLVHINDTIKNIMLLDADRNMKIFGQKIADRDKLTQQIISNEVSTGEIDIKDQPFFDAAKKDVEAAFLKWGGNWNDTKGFREYQDKVNNLKDVSAHAQTRWAMKSHLNEMKASQTLPYKQKQIQDFIDKQDKKPFWDHIDPYQQMFSFDPQRLSSSLTGEGMSVEGAGGVPEFGNPPAVSDKRITKTTGNKTTVTDVQTTVPEKKAPAKSAVSPLPGSVPQDGLPPIFNTTKKYWDYDAMLRRADSLQVANEEDAENQREWLRLADGYTEGDKKKFIDAMNNRLAQYNSERGFVEGQKGYVDKIKFGLDPQTGVSHIQELPSSFAAKTALAGINGNYVSTEYSFNKDAAKYRLDQDALKLKKDQLKQKWFDSNTKRMAVNLRARLVKNLDEESAKTNQVWDNISQSIEIPPVPTTNFGSVEITDRFKLDANQLPEGFTYVGGVNSKGQPIQLIPKDGEPIYKFDKSGKKTDEIVGYRGGYYNVDYFSPTPSGTNVKITSQELYDAYAKNPSYKGKEFKDFVNDWVKKGILDFQLEGQNGKANRVSSYISQKALGNKLTKKGQIDPYANDELDLMGIDTDNSEDQ